MDLIIVESPTKARTFSKILSSKDYTIEATMGHIRDLPANKISVDVEHDFEPVYVILDNKKETVSKIQKLAKKARTILLATDSDREGEAISYHIAFVLGFAKENWPTKPAINAKTLKRIVFHEITESAIKEALSHPRELNLDLAEAQQARRLLDRVVGYKLSPLLWKKMGKRWLSAGRVQTVALRFIVEREKEIKEFESEPFFRIKTNLKTAKKFAFEAGLDAYKTESFEKKTTIQLFDGKYTFSKTTIDTERAQKIQKDLQNDTFTVAEVEDKTHAKTPPPPYTTSTLQQDASRLLGYSAKLTMSVAQQLYEKGIITYHRTDSLSIASQFVTKANAYVKGEYGADYVPSHPRAYANKSKGAQEAHEAIRPTDVTKLPSQIDEELGPRHKKLYELIRNRTLATVMSDAQIATLKVRVVTGKEYKLSSNFETIVFDGYLRLYESKNKSLKLPDITKGSKLELVEVMAQENFTTPPPRYSEGSLIKALESNGIGRPSTYAPTISTTEARNYIEKKEGKLFPTLLGNTVCTYLSSRFPKLFEIDFTAKMEAQLDDIAEGKGTTVELLKNFYGPFDTELQKEFETKGYIDVQEKTDEKCPTCGSLLLLRYSKFGKFFACSKYPDCKYTKSYVEKANQKCPKCETGEIVVKYTKRKKRFYGCSNYPNCDYAAWKLQQSS